MSFWTTLVPATKVWIYIVSNFFTCLHFQRHPAVTPTSYPQIQAPIVSNPTFWERIGSDTLATDMLFFAFYYQQVSFPSSLRIYPVDNCLVLMSFCCYRIRTNNTWLQENWRSNRGDFTEGTILGSSGMSSRKLQRTSMSGAPMCTLISMSPKMAQDGTWTNIDVIFVGNNTTTFPIVLYLLVDKLAYKVLLCPGDF